jgi:CxxC motif-containing protein (DUF1111 family)
VGRFGWKAQQADLLSFSGDAYLNEMGVTNRLFPIENAPNGDVDLLQICDTTPDPEDIHDNIDLFTDFMQFLAPPPRGAIGASELAGEAIATNIGCLDCHRPTYTAVSPVSAIDGQSVHAYSDFLLHDIGTGDGIVQGDAQGNEIRTAPLWGLRRSGPYLHDGRARRVTDAIEAHGGQAQAARDAFAQLPSSNRAALLKFLRSL